MSVSSVLSPSSIVVQPKVTTSQPATAAKSCVWGGVGMVSNVIWRAVSVPVTGLRHCQARKFFVAHGGDVVWVDGVVGNDAKVLVNSKHFDGIKQTTMGFIAVADTDFIKSAVAVYGRLSMDRRSIPQWVFFVSLDDGTDGLCGV